MGSITVSCPDPPWPPRSHLLWKDGEDGPRGHQRSSAELEPFWMMALPWKHLPPNNRPISTCPRKQPGVHCMVIFASL